LRQSDWSLLWQGCLISLDGKFRIDSSMQQQRDLVIAHAKSLLI